MIKKKLQSILFKILTTCFMLMNIQCNESLTAEIPSYIEIVNFDYYGNLDSYDGYNTYPNEYQSTNITDAWVTMDGQALGVFELPCTIPILNDGLHTFTIYPGIKVNGIAGNRIKYPFYSKFETDIMIERNTIVDISPKTSYENASFELYPEGQFELPGNSTILTPSIENSVEAVTQTEVVFQGEKSAAIYLDEKNTYFDITNIEALDLQPDSFLELNFKSNIGFNIGLMIISPNNEFGERKELIQLYPTEEWKKIYLDLGPLIDMGNIFSTFKIYFEGNYDNTQENNAVYLDNIKLVFSE